MTNNTAPPPYIEVSSEECGKEISSDGQSLTIASRGVKDGGGGGGGRGESYPPHFMHSLFSLVTDRMKLGKKTAYNSPE